MAAYRNIYTEGEKLGECFFVENVPRDYEGQKRRAKFRCQCGNYFITIVRSVTTGCTKSCGCLRSKMCIEKNRLRRPGHAKNHPDYVTWKNMKSRCYNVKNDSYHSYGGRGITVCERWIKSFITFIEDMGPKPSTQGYSLERIDNEKGYCKDNCKWATVTEQCNNTRKTIRVEYKDEVISLHELSVKTGMPHEALLQRISRYKWSVERAINTPIKHKKR